MTAIGFVQVYGKDKDFIDETRAPNPYITYELEKFLGFLC